MQPPPNYEEIVAAALDDCKDELEFFRKSMHKQILNMSTDGSEMVTYLFQTLSNRHLAI